MAKLHKLTDTHLMLLSGAAQREDPLLTFPKTPTAKPPMRRPRSSSPAALSRRSQREVTIRTGARTTIRFTLGPLAYLLKNRNYLGEIGHEEERYTGEHEAIIERELFEALQEKLRSGACERRELPACSGRSRSGTRPRPLMGRCSTPTLAS